MAQGYYIIHLEDDKEYKNVIAELRYFAYPGAFASSLMDSFLLSDYGLQPQLLHISKFGKMYTTNATVNDLFAEKGKYSEIALACKQIFLKRNPRVNIKDIQ